MAQPDVSSDDAYTVAWRLYRVTDEARQAFDETAAEHGLTAVQARSVLRLFEATPMGALASHLACDASNITGVADRLIERGLVVSRPGTDRRVKLLELTARGERVRTALQRRIAVSSPSMTRLTAVERRQLVVLLDKLLAAAG